MGTTVAWHSHEDNLAVLEEPPPAKPQVQGSKKHKSKADQSMVEAAMALAAEAAASVAAVKVCWCHCQFQFEICYTIDSPWILHFYVFWRYCCFS